MAAVAVEPHRQGSDNIVKPVGSTHPYVSGFPSLFATDSEDESSSDGLSDGEEQAVPSVLPLDEVITTAPRSLAALLEVLLPRLQPRAEVKGVSIQDQQNLASLLVGELASQFSVIQHQVDDPFLNQQQNEMLHRQIVVQVCKIIEELYAQYTAKTARLSEEGVFSQAANLSRLRAQLAVQANRSINIPAIRRKVLAQLRGPLPSRPSRLPPIPRQERKQSRKTAPSLDQLMLGEPLKDKMSRFGIRLESSTIGRRVQKLKAKMPKPSTVEEESDSELVEAVGERVGSRGTASIGLPALRRVPSMPELWGNFLLCDLGLAVRTPHNPSDPSWHLQHKSGAVRGAKQHSLGIQRPQSVESLLDLKLDVSDPAAVKRLQLGECTFQELSDDVKELSTQIPSTTSLTASGIGANVYTAGNQATLIFSHLQTGVDDLHPLLQAHVHALSEKQVRRLAEFDSQQRKLKTEHEEPEGGRPGSGSSFLERSIPSVPTMDQLPYLTIAHASGPGSSLSAHSMRVKSGASLESEGSIIHDSMPMFGSDSSSLPGDSEEEQADVEGQSHVKLEAGASEGMVLKLMSGMERSTLLEEEGMPSERFLGPEGPGASQLLGESRLSSFFVGSGLHMTELSKTHTDLQGVESVLQEPSRCLTTTDVGGFVQSRAELGPCESRLQVPGRGHLSFPASLPHAGHRLQEGENVEGRGSTNVMSSFSFSSEKPPGPENAAVEAEPPQSHSQSQLQPQPQPAVITTRISDKEVVRTSDIRVSERTPLNQLRLKLSGPIYNELTGELDSSMIEKLDSNLNEGKEITAVYKEIMKTLPTTHLQFDSEATLEPSLSHCAPLSRILASDTLNHRRSRRIINPQLYRDIPTPWAATTRKDWEKSNQYHGQDPKQLEIMLGSGPLSPEMSRLTREYTTWRKWWRSTLDSQDYLQFTSREESDYLRLVYHLYDSEGSDSETEQEERERKERQSALHAKLEAKEAKRQRLHQQKRRYEDGMWNINTVTMGGLGGEPDMSSDEEELEALRSHLGLDRRKVHAASPEAVQERLQLIWDRLHFPQQLQIDMAIKYSSSHIAATQLNAALELWETACDMIEKREIFLSKLEIFEKEASDPSRFFNKGQRGSSAARLKEAKTRDKLHKLWRKVEGLSTAELDRIDKQVCKITRRLQSKFGDLATYKGRPYHEKMSSDRTEMLYWLQQERRQALLRPAVKSLNFEVVIPLGAHS